MRSLFLALLAALALSACGERFNIRHLGYPAINYWMTADGTRLNHIEEMKAELECGSLLLTVSKQTISIYEQILGSSEENEIINHQLTVDGCMEHSGLRRRWEDRGTLQWSCRSYPYLSACQPNAVFPERSVERRLNSRHCKLKTDVEYCRKHSSLPFLCGLTDRENCVKKNSIRPCKNHKASKGVIAREGDYCFADPREREKYCYWLPDKITIPPECFP